MNTPKTTLRLALVVMAITQLVGWGVISLPAVIGEQLAADLGMSLPAVFAGTTVMLVVMGLAALVMSRPFIAFGARRVMAVGALVAALGLAMLAAAQGPLVYFAGWIVLGVSGAASLSTGAYILFNEIAGAGAKRPIGALMLVTGLSSSVFWPITHALSGGIGWRATLLVYAVAMAGICFPLYIFGLPVRAQAAANKLANVVASEPKPLSAGNRAIFPLIGAAVTLNSFASWGLSAIIIQLLRGMGIDSERAIQLGAMLGVAQVSARALDFLGGARWNGLTTGLISGAIMPLGIAVLLWGGSSSIAILGFFLLYGMASGAMAVARATMPLVFYDQAEYARASSRLAFLTNFCSAASPPLLVAILAQAGSSAVLSLVLGITLAAFLFLLALAGIHRRETSS